MKIWIKSLAAIALGILVGFLLPRIEVLQTIFNFLESFSIKALIFITKPLLFFTIIVGFYKLKDSQHAFKIFPFFSLITFGFGIFAIIQSFILGYILKPGIGLKVFNTTVNLDTLKNIPNIYDSLLNFFPSSFNNVISGNIARLFPTFLIAMFIGLTIVYAVKRGQIFYSFAQSVEEILEYISLYFVEIFTYFMFFIAAKLFVQLRFTANFIYLIKYLIIFVFALIIQSYLLPTFIIGIINKKNPAIFFKSISGAQLTALGTGSTIANYPSIYFHSNKNLGIPKEYSSSLSSLGVIFNIDGIAIFTTLSFFFLYQIFNIPFSPIELIIILLYLLLAFFIKDGFVNPEIPILLYLLSKAEIIPLEAYALIFLGFFIFKRLSAFITTTSILTINFLISDKFFNKAEIKPHHDQI